MAVQYDLLRHGYRLQWLGTPRLPWGDAIALVAMQPPEQSALFRELYPDQYNLTREVQVLEILAVMLQTANIQRGGGKTKDFPRTFSDLLEKKQKAPRATEKDILADIKRMQERLG